MEGKNPASSTYVTNDFLSPPQEQGLRFSFFFFPPSLKNSGLLTRELNRQQVFLIKKGFAGGKEVILTSLVSCAGCRGTFWHIWAFQNCCLRGPRHPHRVRGRA